MTNNDLYLIIGIVIAAFAGGFIPNYLAKRKEVEDDVIENKFAKLSTEALKSNTEQFLTLAKEVLNSEKKEIKTDLDGKKAAIAELIAEIRKDLKRTEEAAAKTNEDSIKSFTALKSELENYKEITGELKTSTEKLKELLSNNQMRGAFGEEIADNLLKMAGFVIHQDYEKNEQQTKGSRPDFTIFLPDKTKINIDAKFPLSALVKYTEATDKNDRERHFKEFERDVKEKIKQVTTREYINPEDKTVDFVIMFIPNEMIFSVIYEKMPTIWEEAMKKKVILAGPFSFTAILRMVKQAYSNFRYQENLHQIIGLIQKFDTEYQKYNEELDKLGDKILSASKQYEVVSTTRNRQLTTVVDKIKTHEIKEEKEVELLDLPKN